MLRPSNFHRHHGGWLPPNQHRHCGVLQCSRRSFWALFPENSPSVFHRAACSDSHLNAAFRWLHASRRHRPPSPTRPLPNSRDSVGTTVQLCGADFTRRTCFCFCMCIQILSPTVLAVAISTDRSYGRLSFPSTDAIIDITQVVGSRELRSKYAELFDILHVLPCMFLSRLLASQHPAARLQDSYNLNGCRHGTILRWKNDGRRRTQLHCFAACRRLLLCVLNKCSGVNRYSQCRLRWLILGRDHSARPHLTRLNSIELNHLSWIELSQVGCCAQGFRL